jgi:hypothetical protein
VQQLAETKKTPLINCRKIRFISKCILLITLFMPRNDMTWGAHQVFFQNHPALLAHAHARARAHVLSSFFFGFLSNLNHVSDKLDAL